MRRLASILTLSLLMSACTTASVVPTDTATNTAPAGETLVIQGSDTEVQVVSNLAEAFAEQNTGTAEQAIDISVTGGGSAVGIAALINGTTDIANSSRLMNAEERAQAEEKGVDVQQIAFALDALSVVTHPDNALASMSVADLGRIYRGEITNWKELGGDDAAIVLYGRQSTSGTFGFFRDTVLKADYSPDMRQMEGTQAIVEAVAADEHGIGYVGVGYLLDEQSGATDRVHVVALESAKDDLPISPLDKAAVLAGNYPLARSIYQYFNGTPVEGSTLKNFLIFELSPAGQAIVEESGFYEVTAADRAANAATLGTPADEASNASASSAAQ